jgi:Inner membrane protein YgaP-like, transmembrane domain
MKIETNIHPIERIVRVVVGAALASLAFWGPHSMWFLLGLIPVATGLVGWCPPYTMLGINTCGAKKAKA